MKIDADDLLMTGLIVGRIICAPFLAVYYGCKWFYNHTPWELKKKKELDKEIHLLEEKLGLYGRNNRALHYDSYYYKNMDWYREDYLNDLEKKVEKSYQSPDIILAIKEIEGGIAYSIEYSGKCQVLMLANKNIYDPHRGTSAFFDFSNAETYFKGFYNFIRCFSDLQGRLYTLTECGDMKNYFVVKIPGEFECREVSMENEKIKLFVENFKKNYKKEGANHFLCQ